MIGLLCEIWDDQLRESIFPLIDSLDIKAEFGYSFSCHFSSQFCSYLLNRREESYDWEAVCLQLSTC